MRNEFLSEIKTAEEMQAVAGLADCPQGAALLAVLKRKQAKVEAFLSEPGEHPDEWKRDVRWIMAQCAMLKDLVALPQSAREKLSGQGDGK